MQIFWQLMLTGVALFCFVRAILDFRQRRHLWGVAGMLAAALILVARVPVGTQPVDVDPPASAE